MLARCLLVIYEIRVVKNHTVDSPPIGYAIFGVSLVGVLSV